MSDLPSKKPNNKPRQQFLRDMWQQQKEQIRMQYAAQYGIPPDIVDVFSAGQALIPSCMPLQHVVNSIQNAASGASNWRIGENNVPYFTGVSASGSTIIEYIDDRSTIEFWEQVKSFTDLDADVLLATLGQLLRSPREQDRRSAWIFADTLLDYRGITPIIKTDMPGGKKRRAGHRPEDKHDIAQSMHRITNLWVTVNQIIKVDEISAGKRRKKKRTQYTERSRVLSLESMWYQRELPDNDEPVLLKPPSSTPIGWLVRAGDWLEPFLENRQVAYLCKKVLEYDPLHEMWEKRIARYFFFHFRMNARAGVFNREIGKLLADLSLPIDTRNPERTRRRFQKAMDRLAKDGQVNGWNYTEQVDDKARGWLPTWLSQKIRIHIAALHHNLTIAEENQP